jgi:hypothetical protein
MVFKSWWSLVDIVFKFYFHDGDHVNEYETWKKIDGDNHVCD